MYPTDFATGSLLAHRDPMGRGYLLWKKLWRLGPVIGPGDFVGKKVKGKGKREDDNRHTEDKARGCPRLPGQMKTQPPRRLVSASRNSLPSTPAYSSESKLIKMTSSKNRDNALSSENRPWVRQSKAARTFLSLSRPSRPGARSALRVNNTVDE